MTVQTRPYVLDRIFRYAEEMPHAVAITQADTAVTYRDLVLRVQQLRDDLGRRNIEAETPVMVRLPRGPAHIVAMLAVWHSGLAYLPVDQRDPADRIEEIRRTTGATVAIEASAEYGGHVDFRTFVLDPPGHPRRMRDPQSAHAAYVIFTSGSTGRPKGVAASHESLSTLIELLVGRYGLTAEDRVLQFAVPTFDTAIEQVCVTLASGATLVLPETMWAPSEFPAQIARAGVTVMDLTPSYWREVVAAGNIHSTSEFIRLFILGGAAVTNRDLAYAGEYYPGARIINAYGLTEAGITSALAEVAPTDVLSDGPAAIGHPVDGSTLAVLDASDVPVVHGATGHVAVAGRLALGTTRGDGAVEPLSTVMIDGEPFYRTGDTGYWDEARGLVITGRSDRQLKIRGFRVDPDEIENALRRHPDIRDGAVVGDAAGTTLRGYYTTAPNLPPPERSAILLHLRSALPPYAVPSSLSRLDSLPQTRHGKTDHRALSELANSDLTSRERPTATVALDSATAHAVSAVWLHVLHIDRDRLGVPFFDAGGTSITAAELVARIRASLGIHVRYVRALIERLLRHPDFSSFCQAVSDARAGVLETHTDPRELMEADLARIITPSIPAPPARPVILDTLSTILLTGATGFLGAHLLPRLLESTPARIACLVRAGSEESARERLRTAWHTYGSEPDIPGDAFDRIDLVLGDLAEPSLGLKVAEFDQLAARTRLIVHSGGTVNFIYPYAEMKSSNVDGTYELLRLATVNAAPFHHVSTMAVIAGQGITGTRRVSEGDRLAHLDQLGVGYVESKWVSEQLVHEAGRAGLPVAIYRAADISGHSTRGTWNTATEMCCMKRFIRDIGAIPRAALPMDYTPVDVFTDALVYIATHEPTTGQVYHLTNPHKAHISLLQQRLQERGYAIGELTWDDWVARMIDLAVTDPDHPMTPFAPLFIDKCPSGQMSVAAMYLEDTFPEFTRTNVDRALAGSGITFPHVDADLIDRYLDFLERKQFL